VIFNKITTKNTKIQTKNSPFSEDPKAKMEFFNVGLLSLTGIRILYFNYLVLHFNVAVH